MTKYLLLLLSVLYATVYAGDTSFVTVSKHYTPKTEDGVFVNCGGGDVNITLPTLYSYPNKSYHIKKIDASSNIVDITSEDQIDGSKSRTLTKQWESVYVVNNTSTWYTYVTKSIHDSVLDSHNLTSHIDHGSISGLGDDDHSVYGNLANAETIAGNWVNTANPWADNEVSDTLTCSACTGNAATATALAANPADCAANQFAQSIVASGDLTCATIADADVPDTITIDLAATATALAANGGNCAAGEIPLGVDASGAVEGCYEPAEADISDLNHTATAITDGLIVEADLNADEAPTDNDILTYDTTGANFSWQTPAELSLEGEAHCSEHDSADVDCSGETIVLAADCVAAAEMANADHGDVSWSGGVATVEDIQCTDCITAADIADATTENTKCMIIETPADADDFLFYYANKAITVTSIDCIVEDATSVVITLEECDIAGDNCAGIDGASTITCDVGGEDDDGTLSNPSVDATDWVRVDIGTVTGTPGHVSICMTFTVDD